MSGGGQFIVLLMVIQVCAVLAYIHGGKYPEALFWSTIIGTNAAFLWMTEI